MMIFEQDSISSGMENNRPNDTKNQLPANTADDLSMDYEQLAEKEGKPATEKSPDLHIGLNGGQSKDDARGIDISQYAGPDSKPSNTIDDPEAPYGTGPGNGLSNLSSENTDLE